MYDNVKKEIMIEKHFGCSIDDISKNVIISPVWPLTSFIERASSVLKQFKGWYRGVTLVYKEEAITVISSGIGSPMTGDCVIALGYSDCENILFSGSAGAINNKLNFGDILVCSDAVIGEGFSRYHSNDLARECFGDLVSGSEKLAQIIFQQSVPIAHDLGAAVHRGIIFTTDSILGENKKSFSFMIQKGCDAVEMEVSSVFTAAKSIGRNAAALITISDLPLKQRSLFQGTQAEDEICYKNTVTMLPQILLEAAASI